MTYSLGQRKVSNHSSACRWSLEGLTPPRPSFARPSGLREGGRELDGGGTSPMPGEHVIAREWLPSST